VAAAAREGERDDEEHDDQREPRSGHALVVGHGRTYGAGNGSVWNAVVPPRTVRRKDARAGERLKLDPTASDDCPEAVATAARGGRSSLAVRTAAPSLGRKNV
jgi:hypothetical protein